MTEHHPILINRRDSVIAVLAAAMAGNLARAQSQGTRKPFVIALLPDFVPEWAPWLKTITDGLQALGRVEGRDYVFYHSNVFYGPDSQLAVERVLAANPDLILVINLGYAVQAHKLTKTIPIVLLVAGFPVEAGVANSYARPGKNVTGMTIYHATAEFLAKLVQLLHEVKPGARRIGVLMTYLPPFHPQAESDYFISGLRSAAGPLGIDLRVFGIGSPEQIDATLAAVAAQQVEALVLTSGATVPRSRRQDFLDFAAARRLPTIADSPFTGTRDRPLLIYSASYSALMEKAVPYIDQILWRGANPADLPIQLPSRFEFTVNLKMARAIGITVPHSILFRADTVIE